MPAGPDRGGDRQPLPAARATPREGEPTGVGVVGERGAGERAGSHAGGVRVVDDGERGAVFPVAFAVRTGVWLTLFVVISEDAGNLNARTQPRREVDCLRLCFDLVLS